MPIKININVNASTPVEITWPRPWKTNHPRRLRLIEADIEGLPDHDDPFWTKGWDSWLSRPRKWTEQELEVQNHVDDAYASGMRLWTPEMLRYAEAETARVSGGPDADKIVAVVPFNLPPDGGVEHIDAPTIWDRCPYDENTMYDVLVSIYY